jgi:hypothetical protein
MKGSILAKESKSLPLSKKQAWLLQLGGYCFIRHCFHPSRDQRMKEWPSVQPQYHLCMFSLVVSEAPLACDLLNKLIVWMGQLLWTLWWQLVLQCAFRGADPVLSFYDPTALYSLVNCTTALLLSLGLNSESIES